MLQILINLKHLQNFKEFKYLHYDGSPKEGSPLASPSRTTMMWSQDLQEREALQQGRAVSKVHDDEVAAESRAHAQAQYYLPQDNPPQHPLAPSHHLPPPHPLSRHAADKTYSPPPFDHIPEIPPHTHTFVSDQPPRRSNPYVLVSPFQLASGPCASEPLGHTGSDPPSFSER